MEASLLFLIQRKLTVFAICNLHLRVGPIGYTFALDEPDEKAMDDSFEYVEESHDSNQNLRTIVLKAKRPEVPISIRFVAFLGVMVYTLLFYCLYFLYRRHQ